jgi:hypothetical protein
MVGVESGTTDPADANLRLHGAWAIEHLHKWRSTRCSRNGRCAIWLAATPGAATCADLAEAARLNQSEGCIGINVAGKNERWRAGTQNLLVSRNDLIARQARDTVSSSSEGSTVGGLWRVESSRERINGAAAWARVRLLDRGESQRLQSLYIRFGDAWCQCDLGHQVEDTSEA